MFDVIIIGGGPAGMSCALVLGSAIAKPFAKDRKIAIIAHQKSSNLQEAIFNNAYGITPGTTGAQLLEESKKHLAACYPQVTQILNEKVLQIEGDTAPFIVTTNKSRYEAAVVVVATNASSPLPFQGLEAFVEPHQKMNPDKNRIQLKNIDHLVKQGVYVAGTLAGMRSQVLIAAGSGATVATDILSNWSGVHTQIHDRISRSTS
jgi:thioredoxin reductase